MIHNYLQTHKQTLIRVLYFSCFFLFQAEKRLCGTVSADKNEIMFKEFNINYNNEPEIFKRGTLLLKKTVNVENLGRCLTVIVDIHDDMLKDKFWASHASLLTVKTSKQNLIYNGPITDIISEQISIKETVKQ